MAPFRFPGPFCQTRDWFEDLHDGTLVRAVLASPPTVGLAGATGSRPTTSPATATGDCAYLNPPATNTVVAPQAAFDRLRAASGIARVSASQPIPAYAWSYGPPSAAISQDITLDGRTIRVVRPTDADAQGKNLPSVQQLAEALRAVPAAQRQYTREVALNFRPHPNSTPSSTVAGEAGGGKIDLFPVNRAQSQNDFDNRAMHEAGHNYQEHLWNSPESVQEWRSAAAADPHAPSPYAARRIDDDFCEFNILFNAARGAACEATARQLYPSRWAKRMEYETRA